MKPFLLLFKSIFFTLLLLFFVGSCDKPPNVPDYYNIKGVVIGKEDCNSNTSDDYWLIDFILGPDPPRVGDTLLINGTLHTNLLKTKQLNQQLKVVGIKVSIDYKVISSNKVVSANCTVSNPITYDLKELFIINQGEIR